jgi:hypothetical protein
LRRNLNYITAYRFKTAGYQQFAGSHPPLGVISLNTPIEFDIYGQANSTHIMGNNMMNGIGGSGDYMRNGYETIFTSPSTVQVARFPRLCPW